MFILHIDSGTEMRGGQWQALYLIRGLIAAGHRTRLLAPAGSQLMQAAAAQQVDVQALGLGRVVRGAAGADLRSLLGWPSMPTATRPAGVTRRR